MDHTRTVLYDIPEGDHNKRVAITTAEAVEQQRLARRQAGKGEYASAADALADFLVIHWAWLEEEV